MEIRRRVAGDRSAAVMDSTVIEQQSFAVSRGAPNFNEIQRRAQRENTNG